MSCQHSEESLPCSMWVHYVPLIHKDAMSTVTYRFSLDWSGIEGNLFRVLLIDILVCLQSHYVVYSEIQDLIRILKRFQATNKLFLVGNFKTIECFILTF